MHKVLDKFEFLTDQTTNLRLSCPCVLKKNLKDRMESTLTYSYSFKSPNVTDGLSHPYHLDESIFIFRGIICIFSLLFHFSMELV